MIQHDALPLEHTIIDGVRVAHASVGDGHPVLMIHGWGVDLSLVWPLAERLAPLGYRCILLDMPGFGGSADPPQPWTVFDYAQFVIKFIDALDLKQVYYFGHSFGGRLGLILGAEHPQRFHAMTLADAAGLRKPAPLAQQFRLTLYKSVRDGLKTIGLRSLSDKLRGWYNQRYGSADFNAVSGVMRQSFVNVVNQDLRDYAARVGVSVLLIWGEADEDTPLWQAHQLKALMPDAGLVIYPGAGHYSYLENPQQTAQAMHALFKF